MASEQLIHVSSNLGHSPSLQQASTVPPAVLIPRDPNAMEVDVNAVNSGRNFPPLPSGVSFSYFLKFCHARTLCHKCLKPYDLTHKTADGRSTGCPNPPPTTTREIEVFMQKYQSKPQPSVATVASINHSGFHRNHSAPTRGFHRVASGF
ncbi:uncharacterized protein MELLADRAFT_108990 [Melampsora larici-populina 98AG31]|uniref:Uncharacterized protein n=1 Tax=Melampsora larici-populina (strain 98AG31 / pathotype 3-4-7) TaxID=747676 RepID=F4RUZ2_MELLP|nr:uncharacterized protein MELLADRAFT_108990 [Melampsora larici-populina 98AG31]EGG03779.1 hypothetical protein MELLADRAFT_108990 [Melampsora larici-populina 98AG31]